MICHNLRLYVKLLLFDESGMIRVTYISTIVDMSNDILI